MEPATKICPVCRATVLLYATVCDRCSHKFPPQTLPDKDPDVEASSQTKAATALSYLLAMHAQRGLCLLGAIAVIAGVFMPLVSFGAFDTIIHMRIPVCIVLIALSLIAVGGALLRKYLSVAFLGMAMLTYQCMMLIPRWNAMRSLPDELNSGRYALHIQYGWFFLILGPMLLILGSVYDLLSLPPYSEERAVIERKRGRFLLACLAGMGTTVLLVTFLHTLSRIHNAPRTAARPAAVSAAEDSCRQAWRA